jgi:PadR family transcriptional regulator AphA
MKVLPVKSMSIKHAVLGLLAEGEKSGYDLVREFDYRRSVVWPAPQNEIYRELAKLSEVGWIRPYGPQSATPRGRKLYTITAAGRRELRRWLLADDVDHSFRYEPVLRAVFLTQLKPEELRLRISRDLKFFERCLATLQKDDRIGLSTEDQQQLAVNRRFARPLVAGFYESLIRWSQHCLRDIAAEQKSSGSKKPPRSSENTGSRSKTRTRSVQ